MVIYEVNLVIKNEIFDDYYHWLIEHIEVMLQYPGFKEARIQRLVDHQAENHHLTICYSLASQADLDNYLTHHAPAMREDGIRRFGNQFSATRRVFEVIKAL